MNYVSMNDLAVIALLLIILVFMLGGLALTIAAYFEDTVVRPITEDEFDRFMSRPPN